MKIDNPRASVEPPAKPPLYGSLVNSQPMRGGNWVVVVVAIAAALFLGWPFLFLFMVSQ